MFGKTNSGAIFAKGNNQPITPFYSGTMNFVTSDDGKSGWAEFLTSGTLVWINGVMPKTVDVFAVGGGGGGGALTPYVATGSDTGGGGGGGGFTTTVKGIELGTQTEITIGAGGAAGTDGGTTSVGDFCVAEGGKTPTNANNAYAVGGDGGSGGGNGGKRTVSVSTTSPSGSGGNGGSNGSDAIKAANDISGNGLGQGTPTTDLLGRIHAAGGGGGGIRYKTAAISGGSGTTYYYPGGVGGASDFTAGSGGGVKPTSPTAYQSTAASGGGGYGGGGAGGSTSATAGQSGGQGFAMIAWGDYIGMMTSFTELEYIESTGTQYINTGIIPSANLRLDMTFMPSEEGQSDNAMFGASWSNDGFLLTAYKGKFRFHSKGSYIDLTGDASGINTISCTPTAVTFNGTTHAMTGTGSNTTSYPIYLFWVGDQTSPNNKGYYKLCPCKIYEGDVMIRDMIPIKRGDGSVCMYDRVNEVFYKNDGTGAFIAGPEV